MRTLSILLLLIAVFIATPSATFAAPGDRAGGQKQQQDPCPCPCDPQAAANFFEQQLTQLANDLGRSRLDRIKAIAKGLRDVGNDLKKGKITPEQALEKLQDQEEKLKKLAESIDNDIEDVENDESLTPKRKETKLRDLNQEKQLIETILNGVTNRKGEKVKLGLRDLIECLKRCIEAQKQQQQNQ